MDPRGWGRRKACREPAPRDRDRCIACWRHPTWMPSTMAWHPSDDGCACCRPSHRPPAVATPLHQK